MNSLEVLSSYDASNEEKLQQERIMRLGNRVLKTYHARIQAKLGKKYRRIHFRKELFHAMKSGQPIKIHGFAISETDLSLVKQVQAIELQVLSTYAKLIGQFCRRFVGEKHDNNLSLDDYHNEAVIAVMNAIYNFTKNNRFCTYVHYAIHRSLLNASNNAKPLSPWSQRNKKLYGQFDRMRQKAGHDVSFDQLVEMMDLDPKSIADLKRMLTRVVNQSELVANSAGHNSRRDGDSTDLSEVYSPKMRIASEGIFSARTEDDHNANDFLEAARQIPMSDWERAVFEAFISGQDGWATNVANTHLNPATGQRFSRRAPKLVLDRVLARIRSSLVEAA